MKLSIIIPVYNSEQTIELVVEDIINHLENKIAYEIILIDDFSLDNSYLILEKLGKTHKNLKIVKLEKNYGQQNAIFAGLNFVTGKYVLTMDDDLQHNIEYYKEMMDQINKGYDLVYGIDTKNNGINYKTLGAKLRDFFFKLAFPKAENNNVSSFRIFKSDLLGDILKTNYHFIYLSGILLRLTPKITYINVHNRKSNNQSNYSFFKLFKLFLKLVFYYSRVFPDQVKPKGEQYTIEKTINI